MVQDDLKYTKDHEWVRVEGNEAVMGITDHAQSELGDITFVEMPEKGKSVKQGETLSTIESVKAASDVYAPVSGTVVAVNGSLETSPESVNGSPFGDGWICRIEMDDASGLDALMDAAAYTEFLKES